MIPDADVSESIHVVLDVIDSHVDEENERPEIIGRNGDTTNICAIAKDGRNMYEIDRDQYYSMQALLKSPDFTPKFDAYTQELIFDFLLPYVCSKQPYIDDIRDWREQMRILQKMQIGSCSRALRIISKYLEVQLLLSEPIPCAITTIGKIPDFDYDQLTLISAIKRRGAAGLVDKRILAAANTKGVWIQPGIIDPRAKAKSKHGRPPKADGFMLFGTSQTTFWVKTNYRSQDKVFAVKVFQRNVNFETLGGLWDDCRDTRDVNETVLAEINASLETPGLVLTGFCASMRNYRFRLTTGKHINLQHLFDIFRGLRATTHPYIFAELDVARYPSLIVEIDVPNHTSKKKRITIKMFQSGKINLDSCVFPEHVTYWYRFINQFFIDHPDALYYPAEEDEYDSDYYYEKAGVVPPARELVDC